jgi:cytoskeletal protein CcmA (bactofilin family)
MWSKSTTPATPDTKVTPSSRPRVDANARIGKTILIKGELSGDENLTIEGRVEGRVELRNHQLTIGSSGKIHAEILAKTVTVIGQIEGNVEATDLMEIRESGSLLGDIRAPRVIIADGANFKGSVDMVQQGSGASKGIPEKSSKGPLPVREDKAPEGRPTVILKAGSKESNK